MTFGNPDPLSNPFNTEVRRLMAGYFKRGNPSELTVPQTGLTYDQIMEQQRTLTVPDTAVPYRLAIDMTRYSGEWGRPAADPTSLFRQVEAEREEAAMRAKLDRELLDNMSDEQRRLMAEFNSGAVMPISRLVKV